MWHRGIDADAVDVAVAGTGDDLAQGLDRRRDGWHDGETRLRGDEAASAAAPLAAAAMVVAAIDPAAVTTAVLRILQEPKSGKITCAYCLPTKYSQVLSRDDSVTISAIKMADFSTALSTYFGQKILKTILKFM